MKKIDVNFKKPSQQQLISLLELYQTGKYPDAEKLSLSITQEFPEYQFGWKVLSAMFKQAGKINKINKRSQMMTQDLEREPTQSEIAKSLGYGDDEINSIMRAYRTHLSLDSPLKDDEDTPYLDLLENKDFIPYDDQLMQESLSEKVDQLLEDLSGRETKILKMRFGFFGEVRTLEEIGKEIGLSRERVRQIEKRAKLKLKAKLESESWVDESE